MSEVGAPQAPGAQAPDHDLFAGIEDDIELEVGAGDDGATQQVSGAAFSRLTTERKASKERKGAVAHTAATEVDTPASNVEREGSVLHRASVLKGADDEDDEDDEDEAAGGQAQGYWDEEDEIEAYYAEKQAKKKNVYDGEDEDALSHSSSSGDDEDVEDVEDAALIAGDGVMRGDMDAETQRLLREVAAKDRLGKGQKVQIKALSGIADKLRKRREEMVEKAAAMRAPEAPSFDDILGLAGVNLPSGSEHVARHIATAPGVSAVPEAVAAVDAIDGLGGDADVTAKGPAAEEAMGAAAQATEDTTKDGARGGVASAVDGASEQLTPVKQKIGGIASFFRKVGAAEATRTREASSVDGAPGEEDEGDGLEIVDDANDGNRIVELPRMTPTKPSPLAFNLEYNKSAEMDDFEEEKPLIDDGIGTDEDSDSESDHSWAVHEEDDVGDNANSTKAGDQGQAADDDTDDTDGGDGGDGGDEHDGSDAEKEDHEDLVTFVRMKDNMKKLNDAENAKSAAAESLKAKKLSNRFLDEEAELSDDEGMGIAVSDDEDDGNAQDVDQHGELKDLIDASGKNLDKNNDATEELHIKWSRQQEAQQLKNILRGLENGFGRRNKGPLDDEDGDASGRRRRARRDDDGDDLNLDSAWPSLFGLGNAGEAKKDEDGEDCEDEIVLRKAAQRKLVESQSGRLFGSDGSFSIPLDEDSQHVLELFGKSDNTLATGGSGDANLIGGSEGRHATKRLRSKDRIASASAHSSEPLSFIGRQSKIQRQTSKSNMGVSMNKTFVFGRKADMNASDSQLPDDERENAKPQGASSQNAVCGAIDFSGLKRELVTKEDRSKNLLATLPRWNKPSNLKKQASGAVFDAVCNQMYAKKS